MLKDLFKRIFRRKRWLAKKIIENCDETPKLRTLKGEWKIEQERMITLFSEELCKEIDKIIINEVINSANKE